MQIPRQDQSVMETTSLITSVTATDLASYYRRETSAPHKTTQTTNTQQTDKPSRARALFLTPC